MSTALAQECAQGRDLGFDGKTLIHPGQIEACNAIFTPPAEEMARARKIIAAFERPENASRGAIQLDGQMVERLHADMARRTIAIADAIAAMGKTQRINCASGSGCSSRDRRSDRRRCTRLGMLGWLVRRNTFSASSVVDGWLAMSTKSGAAARAFPALHWPRSRDIPCTRPRPAGARRRAVGGQRSAARIMRAGRGTARRARDRRPDRRGSKWCATCSLGTVCDRRGAGAICGLSRGQRVDGRGVEAIALIVFGGRCRRSGRGRIRACDCTGRRRAPCRAAPSARSAPDCSRRCRAP